MEPARNTRRHADDRADTHEPGGIVRLRAMRFIPEQRRGQRGPQDIVQIIPEIGDGGAIAEHFSRAGRPCPAARRSAAACATTGSPNFSILVRNAPSARHSWPVHPSRPPITERHQRKSHTKKNSANSPQDENCSIGNGSNDQQNHDEQQ
ncbi:hypothetical protein ACFSTD_15270 [Novosphingobium colocasiae]